MKAFTACVLISLVTLSSAAGYTQVNVTRDGSINLKGPYTNTTWSRFHLNAWQFICTWNVTAYVCHKNGSITITAQKNITSGVLKADGFHVNSYGYENQKLILYNLTIIEHPTTKAPTTTRPTTIRSTMETTTQPTTTHTTQIDTTLQNTTLLIGFLLRENESTTDQTEATSSAFSSTANLTSLAWTNETGVSLMNRQPFSGLDIQITFLVVCGIFILAVLLYFVCCKAREKSRRPIYRPVIGEPQPLQVDGGLRNLLFSFTVW
ncbi:CR1-gamma [Human adenovirus D10]|uniref:29.2K protein n=1 Tax=Human adenovirus D10 TaxID=28275 RepID=K7ZQ26_9ADEN|nr:CR1-gamma [Human adenovirus D10]BAM66658.1 CR1 gamma protein [Human adenovirus D10]BAM66694.1 CR1-gamma protein [Human adenovirus D10]BAM66766.1 CR1-gamma protein [Human adenovirus D10]BAU71326.1 29.2K protein [Human adenovirus D10]